MPTENQNRFYNINIKKVHLKASYFRLRVATYFSGSGHLEVRGKKENHKFEDSNPTLKAGKWT